MIVLCSCSLCIQYHIFITIIIVYQFVYILIAILYYYKKVAKYHDFTKMYGDDNNMSNTLYNIAKQIRSEAAAAWAAHIVNSKRDYTIY